MLGRFPTTQRSNKSNLEGRGANKLPGLASGSLSCADLNHPEPRAIQTLETVLRVLQHPQRSTLIAVFPSLLSITADTRHLCTCINTELCAAFAHQLYLDVCLLVCWTPKSGTVDATRERTALAPGAPLDPISKQTLPTAPLLIVLTGKWTVGGSVLTAGIVGSQRRRNQQCRSMR